MSKIREEVFYNDFGIPFTITSQWIEKNDKGEIINDWMLDEDNIAKMIVYQKMGIMKPITRKQEKRLIKKVKNYGVQKFLNNLTN